MIYTLFLVIYKYYLDNKRKYELDKLLYENTDIEKGFTKDEIIQFSLMVE
jgi:hypothetical protein